MLGINPVAPEGIEGRPIGLYLPTELLVFFFVEAFSLLDVFPGEGFSLEICLILAVCSCTSWFLILCFSFTSSKTYSGIISLERRISDKLRSPVVHKGNYRRCMYLGTLSFWSSFL